MGLDTTHDCWHGAYSSFSNWRRKLAKVAGLPPLDLMEGFYNSKSTLSTTDEWGDLPIKWASLKFDVLLFLLNHSDSEGHLQFAICGPLADRLEQLKPLVPDDAWQKKTQAFIDGLRLAASKNENVEFK